VTLRQLRYEIKATPWSPLVLSGLAAIGFAALAADRDPTLASRIVLSRLAVAALAIGASFFLDDPSRTVTDPSPTPLRRRTATHLLTSTTLWAILAVVVLRVASTDMTFRWTFQQSADATIYPAGRIGLEAVAMLTIVLCIAAVMAKRWDHTPGHIVAPTFALIFGLSWTIPGEHSIWQIPGPEQPPTSSLVLLSVGIACGIISSLNLWDTVHSTRLKTLSLGRQRLRSPH
jgi:uncharacterized membrane protein